MKIPELSQNIRYMIMQSATAAKKGALYRKIHFYLLSHMDQHITVYFYIIFAQRYPYLQLWMQLFTTSPRMISDNK